MTIQEAIKSGKPFRKKSWYNKSEYLILNKDNFYFNWLDNGDNFTLTSIEVLADDWEIKEDSISLTKSKLLIAAKTLFSKRFGPVFEEEMVEYIELLSEELGL